METKKIDVIATLKEAFALALKNVLPLILLVVLYVLTVWIPYLNVATTIGFYKAVVAMSHGETIDPLSIFDKENFGKIGDMFLLIGLMSVGEIAAFCFGIIPVFVIGIAWGFAIYFFVEKGIPPFKCLSLSYDVTRGEKWRIFAMGLLTGLLVSLAAAIFAWIPRVGGLFVIIVAIIGAAYAVAVEALMYMHFSEKADALFEGRHHHCCGGHHHAPEMPAEPEAPVEKEAAPEVPESE